jgi:hypothetical protein
MTGKRNSTIVDNRVRRYKKTYAVIYCFIRIPTLNIIFIRRISITTDWLIIRFQKIPTSRYYRKKKLRSILSSFCIECQNCSTTGHDGGIEVVA